jgi:uncharacterized membrane protein
MLGENFAQDPRDNVLEIVGAGPLAVGSPEECKAYAATDTYDKICLSYDPGMETIKLTVKGFHPLSTSPVDFRLRVGGNVSQVQRANFSTPLQRLMSASLYPAVLVAVLVIAYMIFEASRRAKIVERRTEVLEKKVADEPEKVKFAWDLARVKLEAYFDKNLSQVNAIFLVSVVVMIIGFSLVAVGVMISMANPQTKTSYLAAGSGIITEFIAATFMVIYRSTMAQATSFMRILERINTVGMAVQILDAMPGENSQLKDVTRSEIVKLLLAANRDSPK